MKLIKDSNYIKGKKIKNIISESAKLAIRDLVDNLSRQADEKITKFCENLVWEILSSKKTVVNSLDDAMEIKEKMLGLMEEILKC